jgi:hypothetical protein
VTVKRTLTEFRDFPPEEQAQFLLMCTNIGRDPNDFEIVADKIEGGNTETRRKILVRDRTECKTHNFTGFGATWVDMLRVGLKKPWGEP